MPNYSNGKIYKLWSPSHPDDIYIGSTTQPLSKRMGEHRTNHKRYQNGKTNYVATSFKILEYGDARIELIENFECKCKEQLTAREGHYIRTLDCVNKCIPGRTKKEYHQTNKEKIAQQQKQWYKINKEKIVQQHKQWYQANRDKVLQQKKQYKQANRDKVLQQKKQTYQKNKEKIKARALEKITCECGVVVSRSCIARHKRSNKHLQALKTRT